MNIRLLVSAALLGLAAPALAQVAAGSKVVDTSGADVGTITAVNGANVTLKTDKHEVSIPASSFTKGDNGYLFGMTRDQLNAEVDKTMAAAEALVTVGATIKDTAGGTVGTIEALDAEYVTVKLANSSVKLPRNAVAATPGGPVIGTTAAELEAQAGAAAPQG